MGFKGNNKIKHSLTLYWLANSHEIIKAGRLIDIGAQV